jgi:parvulin-like peptidyl-prolyl isomerase
MTDTFRRACLVAAVAIGCAFSAFQILHDVRVPVRLLPGVAARVNGRQIDMDSINRTVAGMDTRERRSESATRRDVLSRMIDEELLVQHALDSGAAETSPEVRAALVRSAITRVNAEAAAEPISEGELTEYFEAHRQVYATAARFDVTPFYFESHDADAAQSSTTAVSASAAVGHSDAATARASTVAGHTGATVVSANTGASLTCATVVSVNTGASLTGATVVSVNTAAGLTAIVSTSTAASLAGAAAAAAAARATAARAAIQAGTPFEQLLNTSDRPPFDSPSQQITPRTLANYFGPATADAVDNLAPGQTTEVTQLGNGVVFIYLNNKIPGEVPSLASIRDLVAADAMRDRQEHALEALLASLHQAARIELAALATAALPSAVSPNAASSSTTLPGAVSPSTTSPAVPANRPSPVTASR